MRNYSSGVHSQLNTRNPKNLKLDYFIPVGNQQQTVFANLQADNKPKVHDLKILKTIYVYFLASSARQQ